MYMYAKHWWFEAQIHIFFIKHRVHSFLQNVMFVFDMKNSYMVSETGENLLRTHNKLTIQIPRVRVAQLKNDVVFVEDKHKYIVWKICACCVF
jgi:hypothetical protein